MMKYLKTLKGKIIKLGKKRPGLPELSNNDVFLVSYPRSGNTWVRFLIANLLKDSDEEIDFHNVHLYVPEISRNNDIIATINPPRVIKSHALYQAAFPKVIYLVRDGRDVYVSYYYYRLNQLEEGCTLSDFLRREDHYPSSWKEHVDSWVGQKDALARVLMIRYEDLLREPIPELERIIDFIGISVPEEKLQQAIQDSRFDKMKAIDQTKGRKYNLTGTKDFVRKGQPGSWREEFSEEDRAYFKEKAGDLLVRLGYEKDLSW